MSPSFNMVLYMLLLTFCSTDKTLYFLCVTTLGPFVMNTQEEIGQAMADYSLKQNGFERARGWQSEISKYRR